MRARVEKVDVLGWNKSYMTQVKDRPKVQKSMGIVPELHGHTTYLLYHCTPSNGHVLVL